MDEMGRVAMGRGSGRRRRGLCRLRRGGSSPARGEGGEVAILEEDSNGGGPDPCEESVAAALRCPEVSSALRPRRDAKL
jgi:hypothetical protein